MKSKQDKRKRRHRRVRAKIKGISDRPRLSVFRSNRHIWVQLIDDVSGNSILTANDLEVVSRTKNKSSKEKVKGPGPQAITKLAAAEKIGETIAKKAQEKNITTIVFDRGGYKYHGIVKAVAQGARKGGLKF